MAGHGIVGGVAVEEAEAEREHGIAKVANDDEFTVVFGDANRFEFLARDEKRWVDLACLYWMEKKLGLVGEG